MKDLKKVLQDIPYDFPICETPYKEMSERMGVGEEELMDILEQAKKSGIIRRLAAILYHRRASYTHNVMVIWRVEEKDMDRVGKAMASFREVSHCYERSTGGYWDYTLYTMIHGKSDEEIHGIVKRMSEDTGVKDFKMFLSTREFKKTSLMVSND